MATTVKLTVNGTPRVLEVNDPDMPLLYGSGSHKPGCVRLDLSDAHAAIGAGGTPADAVMNVDRYGDAVPVPAFAPPRMVRARCGGIIRAYARLNWRERPTQESLAGGQWGADERDSD
jgi:hypothetical protein